MTIAAPTAPTSPTNPVDDKRFTGPLVKALRRHVDRLAATIPVTGREYSDLARRTRIAGAWVYLSAVVAWAEDHGLIDVWLRRGLKGMPGRFTANPTITVRLLQAMAALTVHPATQWLMHPRYNPDLHADAPSDAAIQDLVDWWAGDAPSLAYDVADGPTSISGWIIGDLLQAVTDDRRKEHALAQTPWWVADFILDRTLVPACDEFRTDRLVRTVDPAAGTGHFAIRTMDYLWEWYTTGTLHPRQAKAGLVTTGGVVSDPGDALTRVVASVDGVELDPLTAAVARLRCTVYAAHLAERGGLTTGPVRLAAIPRHLVPRIGVADSLLLGKVGKQVYDEAQPGLADLPGASFTLGDWDWSAADPTAPAPIPAAPIRRPVVIQQFDLFGQVAA
jgi:hypothetical protein